MSPYSGLTEEDEGDKGQKDETDTSSKNQKLNKQLLDHFRHLVDLQFLDEVISDGANPNSSDRFGQTVLHEISRAWSVDVMRFFLDCGSDLRRPDQFGVTALHVAAALDYHDMVQFLLDHKARTHLDQQTPLHYAAKNDAVEAIRLLLRAGATIESTDYKLRTPLQLAANLGRSDAARLLLELGADAGVKDADGQLCITALIGQMSSVVMMSRLLTENRALIGPESCRGDMSNGNSMAGKLTLTQISVAFQVEGCCCTCLSLLLYPDRLGAWLLLLLNFLFNVSWTTVAISVSVRRDSPDRYVLPQDWWRVLLVLLALLLTLEELRLWRRWAERRLHDDPRCSHPMWNVCDWMVYCLLTASFSVHLVDVLRPSVHLHTISLRLFSVTVVFLWLRLMKHVRAFRLMGPFIVMLGNIAGDVIRFLFLYTEIFIPYACSFWIIFGVPSMQSVSGLLYSLYRITLVDEYEYAAMVTVDDVMAPLLCGTFLAASSILCVNLLIALLTDTFQRVHDNSQANAVMQQAVVILQVEDSIPLLRRFYDNRFVSNCCSPLVAACDNDITTLPRYHDETGHITAEIKENKLMQVISGNILILLINTSDY
uniref:Si:ch73-193i2.2 n=1 Tax=Amphiprion percula TaxID=161767 RepID=A0A3P8TDW3_AMPPE